MIKDLPGRGSVAARSVRQWVCFVVGCGWLCVAEAADGGYLPVIGPSPVRFLASKSSLLVAELPPLRVIAVAADSETNAVAPAVSTATAPMAELGDLEFPETEFEPEPDKPLVAEKPAPPKPPDGVSTNNFFVPMLDAPLTVVPDKQHTLGVLDSLVTLFKQNPGGTNRLDPILVLPVNVAPAPALKPPSSTATYSNP